MSHWHWGFWITTISAWYDHCNRTSSVFWLAYELKKSKSRYLLPSLYSTGFPKVVMWRCLNTILVGWYQYCQLCLYPVCWTDLVLLFLLSRMDAHDHSWRARGVANIRTFWRSICNENHHIQQKEAMLPLTASHVERPKIGWCPGRQEGFQHPCKNCKEEQQRTCRLRPSS